MLHEDAYQTKLYVFFNTNSIPLFRIWQFNTQVSLFLIIKHNGNRVEKYVIAQQLWKYKYIWNIFLK